jgi:protein ImuB
LLAGPHRVEGAWWDRTLCDGQQVTRHVARDYWLAWSEHAKLLWVFQTRLPHAEEAAWFLQGYFY